MKRKYYEAIAEQSAFTALLTVAVLFSGSDLTEGQALSAAVIVFLCTAFLMYMMTEHPKEEEPEHRDSSVIVDLEGTGTDWTAHVKKVEGR
jgi:hypothetical protein